LNNYIVFACKLYLNKCCSDISLITPLYSAQCLPNNDCYDGKVVELTLNIPSLAR